MRMDSRLILGGQTPDMVGSMDRGFTAGRRRGLADLYAEHGQDIAAGGQNGLNALAGFDPNAALGIQQTQQGMKHADTRMGYAAENMGWQRDDRARAGQERLDAEQARKTLAQTEKAISLMNSAQTPEQWDQIARMAAPELVGQFGNKEALLAKVMPIAEVLKMQLKRAEPQAPLSAQGKLYADLQAGRITPEQFDQASKKSGMRIQSDGKGGFTFSQGVDFEQEAPKLDVSSPSAMLSSVKGVLNDPAFNKSTGFLSWTQAIPGTDQYRFGTRVKQLNGQAFLLAFESLKGGGQITEVEGQKATEAIGRLDSAQSAKDYREALEDLSGLLETAISRPQGWEGQINKNELTPEVGTVESGYRFIGGDPSKAESWERVE